MKKLKVSNFNLLWIFIFSAPIFILLLWSYPASTKFKFIVLVMASLIYFSLALLHHHHDKSLKLEIILEYALIATLALLILHSLII